MEYTNIMNLPSSIVKAVTNDPYDAGASDISVTSLIGPARKRQLTIKHKDELTEDVADRLFSLYGQIVHGIFERADLTDDDIITERRMFIERHGWRLSGRFDRFVLENHTILQDYKFTSLWTVKDGCKPEHEQQLNIYRLMLQEHGYTVDGLQIIAILRDWSKMRAQRDPGYPQKPVVIVDVPIWDKEKTEAYITERLTVHGNAQTELPECTAEERWATEDCWAVKKKGNKTAVKGCAKIISEDEATTIADGLTDSTGKEHTFEFRQGESKRCGNYCEASSFCEQWQELNPNKLGL